MNRIKTIASESVTEGHPDKICDQISDSILDAIIEKDPDAHVACECFVTTGLVLIGGEITTEDLKYYFRVGRKIYDRCRNFYEVGKVSQDG